MNKDEVLMSLRSFMSLTKMQCDAEGREFDVDAALSAATPVVESLLYTISSGGKMEGEADAGAQPDLRNFIADMLEDYGDGMDLDDLDVFTEEWADKLAEFTTWRQPEAAAPDVDVAQSLGMSHGQKKKTVDDIFDKMIGGKP